MWNDDLNIRGAVHDINGLMARALLSAESLRSHKDQGVAKQAGRISTVIDQVAAICRQRLTDLTETPKMELLDHVAVERLLRQVADLVSVECTLADRPIDFFVHVSKDVKVMTNPEQLFRILFNLAINAANAISRKGGSWIEISAIAIGERVLFDVCDDGPGLPKHILGYLFPHLAADMARKGGRIGCGLVTSAHLAAELGGELRLVRASRKGTSFCVSLPSKPLRATNGSERRAVSEELVAV
ncbi:MAG: HAMP domain-containing sensor histidine kinase [Pseudomonadota bacterium]